MSEIDPSTLLEVRLAMREMEAATKLYHHVIQERLLPDVEIEPRSSRQITRKVKGLRCLSTCLSLHGSIIQIGADKACVGAITNGGVAVYRHG